MAVIRKSFLSFSNDRFGFMLIVRREISGGKSSISTDDIMLNLMQSKEELRKYHEFLKTNRI